MAHRGGIPIKFIIIQLLVSSANHRLVRSAMKRAGDSRGAFDAKFKRWIFLWKWNSSARSVGLMKFSRVRAHWAVDQNPSDLFSAIGKYHRRRGIVHSTMNRETGESFFHAWILGESSGRFHVLSVEAIDDEVAKTVSRFLLAVHPVTFRIRLLVIGWDGGIDTEALLSSSFRTFVDDKAV